jgi:CheY-like chemotaxis protein
MMQGKLAEITVSLARFGIGARLGHGTSSHTLWENQRTLTCFYRCKLRTYVEDTVNVTGRHRSRYDIVFGERWSKLENEPQHRIASTHGSSHPVGRIVTMIPRVVLADDQEEMLQTVVLMLADQFNVVGTVKNGSGVVDLATRLSPDVIILDVSMPVVNGIEAARRLQTLGSSARVIFLTVHADPEFVEAALSMGALGYVLKPSLATDLIPAIWTAMEGNTFISAPMQLQ